MLPKPVLVILASREEFPHSKNRILQLFPSSFPSILRAHNPDIARKLTDEYGDALYVYPNLYIGKDAALNRLRRMQNGR